MDNDVKKSKSFCRNFFKMFDYFGVNFTFKIKDKSNFKSNLGGKFFVILYSCFYIFYLFIFELLEKTNL